jgi:hypothetical protein
MKIHTVCWYRLGYTGYANVTRSMSMAGATNRDNSSDDKRGLKSASKETRIRVAQMGGKAFHEKRGAKGSDSRKTSE